MADRTCPSCHQTVAAHHTVCLRCRTPVPSEAGPVGDAASSRIWFAPPPPRQRGRAAPTTPDPVRGPTTEPLPAATTTAPIPGVAPAPRSGTDATAVTWAPDATSIGAVPVVPPPTSSQAGGALPSAGTIGADAPTLDERGNLPAGTVGLLGALLVTVGVFLPWITVAGHEISGWSASGDAKALLVMAGLATVASALLVAGARGLLLRIVVLVLGVATVAVAAFDVVSAGDVAGFSTDVGIGLLVAAAGGAVLTVAGLLTRHRRYR